MSDVNNNPEPSDRIAWLIWSLRIDGLVLLCATPFIFIPFSNMATIHAWLGLGEMVETPLLSYLTRSLSAMYAFHGALILFFSFDVIRHWRLIRYASLLTVALGAILYWIDSDAGMGRWWTYIEGPPIASFGLWLLALQTWIGEPKESLNRPNPTHARSN